MDRWILVLWELGKDESMGVFIGWVWWFGSSRKVREFLLMILGFCV